MFFKSDRGPVNKPVILHNTEEIRNYFDGRVPTREGIKLWKAIHRKDMVLKDIEDLMNKIMKKHCE